MEFNPVEMGQKVLLWMVEECNGGRDRFFAANTIAKQFSIKDRQARDIIGVLHDQGYVTSHIEDGNLDGWPYHECELTNRGLGAVSTPPQRSTPPSLVIITGDTVNVGSIYGPAIQAINEAHETDPQIAQQLSALVTALQRHTVAAEEHQREVADVIEFLASQHRQNPPKGLVSAALRYLREMLGVSADLATLLPAITLIAQHYAVKLPLS